jgi:oligosaccharide translocation protein RFT1
MLSDPTSIPSEQPPSSGQVRAADALISLLSLQLSLSVILCVFGASYMPIVVHTILPAQYLSTSAPKVLAAWVWYIPVLAVNGGLEAFLSSVATPDDLNKQSRQVTC